MMTTCQKTIPAIVLPETKQDEPDITFTGDPMPVAEFKRIVKKCNRLCKEMYDVPVWKIRIYYNAKEKITSVSYLCATH